MKQLLFFDDHLWKRFLPLSQTRPIADFRLGIMRISEKWAYDLNASIAGYRCREPLNLKFSNPIEHKSYMWINGRVLPSTELCNALQTLSDGEALLHENGTLIACVSHSLQNSPEHIVSGLKRISFNGDILMLQEVWELFAMNGSELIADFRRITAGKTSAPIAESNQVWNPQDIFIEEGARVEGAMLNASSGPIYIGSHAEVMEGSMIRGPFALCEHAAVKLGCKIYGPTTIGPYSKVGGELNNVVIQGYSNKGHDGFLGNSVLGEWCNIGADSNNSNLKNNYAEVKLWDYESGRFKNTGLQFCGLIMGDHSKCGINTMFNTGTVVGVSANIFGSGFPRNFVPSFAWGGAQGFSTFRLQDALQTASIMMGRRGLELSAADRAILEHAFETSAEYRFWEKTTD